MEDHPEEPLTSVNLLDESADAGVDESAANDPTTPALHWTYVPGRGWS